MTIRPDSIRDAQLPQLHVVRNEAMMQTVLESALQGQIERCRILQCRYKPTKTCLVSYALTMRGSQQERIVYVRIYPENESSAQYQKARAKASLHRHVLHVPAFEMVVWVFPNDRKMTALGELTDAAQLQTEILPRVVAEGVGGGWHITALHHEIIHYVAEHTCTVRAQLTLTQAQTGQTKSPVFFGKTYYNDHGATTFQAMQQLQQHGIGIAPPLSYQPQYQTLWQLGLEGQTLNDLIARDDDSLLEQAAHAVAELHSNAPTVPHLNRAPSPEFNTPATLIALAQPDSKPKLDRVIAQLVATSASLTSRPTVCLHGDLHLKNFFVVQDKIALIDLDNLQAGDPLQDLGSFIASLHYRQLLGEVADVHRLIRVFLQAYQANVSWSVPMAELNWYVAAALLTERVSRCVTRLKASHLIDELINLAAQVLAGGNE